MKTTNPDNQQPDDELDAIFNKPAGDGAFYLRGEIEAKLLAWRDNQVKKARMNEVGIINMGDPEYPRKRLAQLKGGSND